MHAIFVPAPRVSISCAFALALALLLPGSGRAEEAPAAISPPPVGAANTPAQHAEARLMVPVAEHVELVRLTDMPRTGTATRYADYEREPRLYGNWEAITEQVAAGELDAAYDRFRALAPGWSWLPYSDFASLRLAGEVLAHALLEAGDGGRARAVYGLIGRACLNPVEYLYDIAARLSATERNLMWPDTPYLVVEAFAPQDEAAPFVLLPGDAARAATRNAAKPMDDGHAATLALEAGDPIEAGIELTGMRVPAKPFALRAPLRGDEGAELRARLRYWLPAQERGGTLDLGTLPTSGERLIRYHTGSVSSDPRYAISRQHPELLLGEVLLTHLTFETPATPFTLSVERIEVVLPARWQEIAALDAPVRTYFRWDFDQDRGPTWRAHRDSTAAVENGVLRGVTTGEAGLLQSSPVRVDADFINVVEVRMRLPEAARRGEEARFFWSFPDYRPDEHQGFPFDELRSYNFELRRDTDWHTYRLNMAEGYDLDWWGDRSLFSIALPAREGLAFEIDYIAFTRADFEELSELARLRPGRIRLGTDARESLVTTQTHALRFPLTIEGPTRFRSGVGVLDYPEERADDLAEFLVHWQAGGERTLVGRKAILAEQRRERFGWEELELDLTPFAGQTGELILSTRWSRDERRSAPLLRAAWGAPGLWQAAEAAQPPNVLVILIDTLRADALGAYGYDKPGISPNIDVFARQSVVFDHAYSTAPWTWHSVVSMFTSLYVSQFSEANRPFVLDDSYTTVAERLNEAGYVTAGFSLNGWVSEPTGMAQGFDYWFDLVTHLDLQMERTTSTRATEPVMRWLDRHQDKPFFLYAHYLDPHAPFQPPAWVRGRYTQERDGLSYIARRGKGNWVQFAQRMQGENPVNEQDMAYMRELYDEEIVGVDEHVGRLLESLRLYGLEDNTIVVLVSDHGEEFMERGFHGHGLHNSPEANHVPFIWRVPGMAPARIGDLSSPLDLGPTLLSLLGLENLPGASGIDLFDAAARTSREALLLELLDYREMQQLTLRTPDYVYQKWVGERPRLTRTTTDGGLDIELYELATDPREMQNLAGVMPELAERLDQQLETMREGLDRSMLEDASTAPAGLTDSQREKLEAMGYL